MKSVSDLVSQMEEVADTSLAFLRETRTGTANIEQANVVAKESQRVISAVAQNVKTRLIAPKLAEIEKAVTA